MAVVDILEIVEVDEKHRKRLCACAHPVRLCQAQELTVLETGKKILAGLAQQFIMVALLHHRNLAKHVKGEQENQYESHEIKDQRLKKLPQQ